MKEIYLGRTELDNVKWLSFMENAIKTAKHFEVHCWDEEADWIEFALQYG